MARCSLVGDVLRYKELDVQSLFVNIKVVLARLEELKGDMEGLGQQCMGLLVFRRQRIKDFKKRRLRAKRLSNITENVTIGILFGVVKVSGFFTSSIMNSNMSKKIFSLMPGEMVLPSLNGFIGELQFGRGLHGWVVKFGFDEDNFIGTAIVDLYVKCGIVDDALKVLSRMKIHNVVSWTAIISGFVQMKDYVLALEFFMKMRVVGIEINKYTITMKVSLINMYSKGGEIGLSELLFRENDVPKNVDSWEIIIFGFTQNHNSKRTMEMFCKMYREDQALNLLQDMMDAKYRPDQVTIAAILTACSSLQSLWKGKEVHGYALRVGIVKDTVGGGALVNMTSKCRFLTYARRIFESMPRKDLVSWFSLISGYAKNEYVEDSLKLFHNMIIVGLETDAFVIYLLLGMTAKLTKLKIDKQLHACNIKVGLDSDPSVGSPLVEMYSKCRNVEESQEVFDMIEQPDLVTWTLMIVSYAQHGKGLEALRAYDLMREKGIKPDLITFVGVLSTFSHNGMVEEGYFHLNSMTQDYGINPGLHHYACMVDLLERDVELGRLAAERVLELEPSDSGTYISTSLLREEAVAHFLNFHEHIVATGRALVLPVLQESEEAEYEVIVDIIFKDNSPVFGQRVSHLVEAFYNGLMALPILGSVTTFEVMV
ncbi:hypothetical protein GIB67_007680 [Kingdonia uniflora]|uniref:Pentatricopeptide repeat-containing protein n=1 Tax=Kingdonia uniflora TaxID=39325 RepID=A0A7J7N1H0_9MAGN|nr:hypothetical protein GIB67_007680 [Kingdonia uniflora]